MLRAMQGHAGAEAGISETEPRRYRCGDACTLTHVSLAEKWHRDAGTGTSEMDGDEEKGIAMKVQVRMLQDCETCIRTCSARHAVGLRVVARGRQVLAGRAIHACGRRQ